MLTYHINIKITIILVFLKLILFIYNLRFPKTSRCTKEMDVRLDNILNPSLINGYKFCINL